MYPQEPKQRTFGRELTIGIVVTVIGGLILHLVLRPGPEPLAIGPNLKYAHVSGALQLQYPRFLKGVEEAESESRIGVQFGSVNRDLFSYAVDDIFGSNDFMFVVAAPVTENELIGWLALASIVTEKKDGLIISSKVVEQELGFLSNDTPSGQQSSGMTFRLVHESSFLSETNHTFLAGRLENGVLVYAFGKVNDDEWDENEARINESIDSIRVDTATVLNRYLDANGFLHHVVTPDDVREATPAGLTLRYQVKEQGRDDHIEIVRVQATTDLFATIAISTEYADGSTSEKSEDKKFWSELVPRIPQGLNFYADNYEAEWDDSKVASWAHGELDADGSELVWAKIIYKQLPAFVAREYRRDDGEMVYSRVLLSAAVE